MNHLINVLTLEAERGCRYLFFRNRRFSNHVRSELFKAHHGSNRLFIRGLSQGVSLKNSGILSKVAVFMGFGDIEESEVYENPLGMLPPDNKYLADESDIALSCARFPCITLGDSSIVELYDGVVYEASEVHLSSVRLHENGMAAEQEISEVEYSIESSGTCANVFASEESKLRSYPSQPSSPDVKEVKPSADKPIRKKTKVLSNAEYILDKPVRYLPGISARCWRQLEDGGFYTARKLLQHFPRTYADLQDSQDAITDGQFLIFVGTVISSKGIKASISFAFTEVVVACKLEKVESKSEDLNAKQNNIVFLHLKKYFRGTRFTNQFFLRSLQSKYEEGNRVCVSGKVKKLQAEGHYEMREYSIDIIDEERGNDMRAERRPYPLYPAKAGLTPGFLRETISRVLRVLERDIDPIPVEVLNEFNLVNLRDAYVGIHLPRDLTEADSARRRLIFDDFFYLQLGRLFQMLEAQRTPFEKEDLLNKYRRNGINVIANNDWCALTKNFLEALPYSLTPSQLDAVSEIIWDLKRPVPMNRLLQGDVGCGKTVVSFLACMEVIGSGFQAAFMVPSELLAMQHYEHLLSLIENIKDTKKPCVSLLTGSTTAKQARIIREGLRSGEIDMVIGTHSLIADKIEFFALRIAVVDEQQRFGVIQRGRFNSKLYYTSEASKMADRESEESNNKSYMAPHVLAMSATPIPRTLALALYGDVSLTQITDLPPGRKPIKTHVLQGDDGGLEIAYDMMLHELKNEGKVYLVYPIIKESEQLPQLRAAAAEFEFISERFNGYQCGLLHGRMKGEEKDRALQRFRTGEVQILLSTQVIEIGVDVPDASMMVVMNAERFGISQLHQLRGRVGRGTKDSTCVLLASGAAAVERLKVLEKSCDGFYLANADLLIRGPGNLLGKKQSGHLPEFPIARLEVDGSILQEAHLAALRVLGASNDLQGFPKLRAELSMRQPLCLLGD